MFRHISHASIDRVEAPDPQTITVKWKAPFIEADSLFGRVVYPMVMPKHILEKPYLEDKAGFTQLSYWTSEFVGAGPFKLREMLPGSHLIMDANDRYVRGRPKIDVVEFKFILDLNTMITTVIAGGADMTAGFGISPELAVQTRQRWQNGEVRINPTGWVSIYPQMLNPSPAVVGDPRFRRALVHAIDRQQLAGQPRGHVRIGAGGVEFLARRHRRVRTFVRRAFGFGDRGRKRKLSACRRRP